MLSFQRLDVDGELLWLVTVLSVGDGTANPTLDARDALHTRSLRLA
jgi:hypothetical protein